ncbi:MAG: SDR family oxidoreductase [Candidatus Hodarchaeota archaeon]
MEERDKPMKDNICMVTGATSGVGEVTAQVLAQQGATVIIVGRNPEKGATTVSQIKQQTGTSTVEFILADLSSQQAIHQLVEQFKRRYQRLDVLVNNAGASFRKRQNSVDGIEMTFALNHLGYFLLTNLLLDTLKSSAPARIVNVSSGEHKRVKLNFDDLQAKQKYSSYRAYKQSKLCNILFTYELTRRLEGTDVTVNAVTPGLVKTKLGLEDGGFPAIMKRLINFLAGKSPEEGAKAIIYLATSPDVEGVTGKYFVKQEAVPSSNDSYDKDIARRLWQVSAKLTRLSVDDVP